MPRNESDMSMNEGILYGALLLHLKPLRINFLRYRDSKCFVIFISVFSLFKYNGNRLASSKLNCIFHYFDRVAKKSLYFDSVANSFSMTQIVLKKD